MEPHKNSIKDLKAHLPVVSEHRLEQIRAGITSILREYQVTFHELKQVWESEQSAMLDVYGQHIGPLRMDQDGNIEQNDLITWMLTPLPPPAEVSWPGQ